MTKDIRTPSSSDPACPKLLVGDALRALFIPNTSGAKHATPTKAPINIAPNMFPFVVMHKPCV